MNAGPPNEVYQFVVLCLDRQTGKPLWQKIAREEAPIREDVAEREGDVPRRRVDAGPRGVVSSTGPIRICPPPRRHAASRLLPVLADRRR